MRKSVLMAITLAAATTIAVSTAAPASAAGGTLLTVRGPGGVATLTCGISSGSTSWEVQACADIAAAKGVIADIPPLAGYACLAYYDPTPVSVTGVWEGQAVNFFEIESNPSCAMISHGHVFNYHLSGTSLTVRAPGGVATLLCAPPGGTHPYATEACGEIKAADGVIADIPPLGPCPMYIAPVPSDISVTGVFAGRVINFHESDINPACAGVSHGHVFSYTLPSGGTGS